QGAQQAQVTSNVRHNVVSREHWIGFDATDSILVRAGHMEIPFGIRDIVHDYYVRQQTRTDINQQQTDGLSVSYSGSKLRGEIMGIAGNMQVKPADFRDHGYSGYLEYSLFPKTTVGVSSLATHAQVDLQLRRTLTRTANGVFIRTSPWTPLVFEFEEDGLVNEVDGKGPLRVGNCGVFVTDLEPIQGIHAIGAFEWFHDPMPSIGTSFGGWAGLQWFFAPHADARVDYVINDVPAGTDKRLKITTIIYQFHFFL
ncbi:MAG TPA: hypothetical protein VMV18_01785, partial [bacterium]|nr:hypothetical protein [bacterium]